jgi:hypothetical protein
VKAASSETRSHIFYRAQLQRWRNWREPATKEIMERTIPVFRALVASDTAGEFHANHAQLGYALKDQRNPDWAEAESSLSRAIAIRGSAQTHNEHGYEFNRAICRIMLDPEFQLGQPSKPEARARIENDLATAEHDEWVRGWLAKDTTIARWRELNKRAR